MSAFRQLELTLLPGRYAIFRTSLREKPALIWPTFADDATFVSITRTRDELSGVCEESHVPPNTTAERARRLLRVKGPLDFSLTGILASLASPLAEAQVGIFAISTYETDYLLLAQQDLDTAIAALERAGHTVHRSQTE